MASDDTLAEMRRMNVCPAAKISAPVERVWALLSEPAEYGTWMDGRVDAVNPPGPARPGQLISISAPALGKRFLVTCTVESVDAERHQIAFQVALPFGIAEHTQITCTALDVGSCLVRFG